MIIENNFKLFSILLIMGVLNEKRCKIWENDWKKLNKSIKKYKKNLEIIYKKISL
jgi:hypothetical protein